MLLAVLGTQQFMWIGQVSDYERRITRMSVRGPALNSVKRIRDEIGLLLWMFNPGNDVDGANRSERYLDRYLLWHAISKHGTVVKRILFYDAATSEIEDPTELFGKSRRIEETPWDENLALVHKHLDEFGIKFGRVVSNRWIVTWIFHLNQWPCIDRPSSTNRICGTTRTMPG